VKSHVPDAILVHGGPAGVMACFCSACGRQRTLFERTGPGGMLLGQEIAEDNPSSSEGVGG